MIKLKPIGPNQTTLKIGGSEFFFSYETLVGVHNGKFLITDKFYSKTTSSHISNWLKTHKLDKKSATEVNPGVLETAFALKNLNQ